MGSSMFFRPSYKVVDYVVAGATSLTLEDVSGLSVG
jgi:hypothetical protein